MSFRAKLGIPHSFNGFQKFNDKEYQCVDPTEFLLDLFSFSKSNFPTNHWELSIIILVGGMGTGKSTYFRYLGHLGQYLYEDDFHCFQTYDLSYALDRLNENIEDRKKVEFIFFDDTMGDQSVGFDSHRSMSGDNLNMSSMLSVLRHKLANEDENGRADSRIKAGYCCACFAIQSPKRIDKFIRDNADLVIYKTSYAEIEKEMSPDDFQFLSDITEDSKLKHIYNARRAALGRTISKKSFRMYFPEVHFEIPVVVPPKTKASHTEMKTYLKKFSLLDINSDVVKGALDVFLEDKKWNVSSGQQTKIINKAKYEQYLEMEQKKREIETEVAKKQAELTERLRGFEGDVIKHLTEQYDLEAEEKGLVKGYFIKYCRDKNVDYNKLDYTAIYHLAIYEQKHNNLKKRLTDPDALSLEILKYRDLVAHSVLQYTLDKIAEIENVSINAIAYREKMQIKKLKENLRVRKVKKNLPNVAAGIKKRALKIKNATKKQTDDDEV